MKRFARSAPSASALTPRIVCVALVLSLAYPLPRPAAGFDFRVEVAPVVSIPLAPLLDGMLYPDVEVLEGQSFNVMALEDLRQQVGFGARLAVLLNDWELRYEILRHGYKSMRRTHVSFVDLVPGVSEHVYIPLDDYGRVASLTHADALLCHVVGVGYRFTPFDWVVRPYVPLGIGFTAVQLNNGLGVMYGANIQVGIGADWLPLSWLRVGASLRYSLSLYKNQDTTLRALATTGWATASLNRSSFEAVLETFQLLTVDLHAAFVF